MAQEKTDPSEAFVTHFILAIVAIVLLSGAVYDLGRIYLYGKFEKGTVIDVRKATWQERTRDQIFNRGSFYTHNSYIQYHENKQYRIKGKLVLGKEYRFAYLPAAGNVHNVYVFNPIINIEFRISLIILFLYLAYKTMRKWYLKIEV